jgi:NCS1 family nucleobase:cation symporter-1
LVSIRSLPQWGIEPVPLKYRLIRGTEYFILWSSLGVGLLVFSAGSFLSSARFADAIFAIIIGSVAGSFLLALAGKIGSDNAVPSLISMRPSFGIQGSYIPAILNVMQLIGWTIFEIMIMSKAAEMLVNGIIPYYAWAIIIGSFIALLGIAGPLTVIKRWIGKFSIWIVYGSTAIILLSLLTSGNLSKILSASTMTAGTNTASITTMSFFTALDLVIAMPISWMPLVADYNRFAHNSKGAFRGTLVGFTVTNILFYFGGLLLGRSDVVAIISVIQSLFFGFLLLVLLADEADNAFADVYSAAVSAQNIFHKVNQRHLIIGFTALSTILAILVPISEYQTFILLIGAVFVPLFGVVLSDYYIVKHQKYDVKNTMYGKDALRIGSPAIISWAFGVLMYYLLSSLSPIYIPQLSAAGATIPSLVGSSLLYLSIVYGRKKMAYYLLKKS